MKKPAVLAAALCFVVATATVASAGWNGNNDQTGMWTYCSQGWDGKFYSAISFYANGNGYADVSWAGDTQVLSYYYYGTVPNNGSYPDRSNNYPSIFSEMGYQVDAGNSRVDDTGYGVGGQWQASKSGYQNYPPEDQTYTMKASHLYGGGENCGQTWSGNTATSVETDRYTPDEPTQLNLLGVSETQTIWRTGEPLLTSSVVLADNTPSAPSAAGAVPAVTTNATTGCVPYCSAFTPVPGLAPGVVITPVTSVGPNLNQDMRGVPTVG